MNAVMLIVVQVLLITVLIWIPAQCLQPLIKVCHNTSCKKAGAAATFDLFRALCSDEVTIEEAGCHGKCGKGPNVCALPSATIYEGVYKPSTAASILTKEYGEAASVPKPVLAAYKAKMYGDQKMAAGAPADALVKYDEALASQALDDRPWALSSLQLARAEAFFKLGKKSRDAQMLQQAEAAARSAIAAKMLNTLAWMRLADILADMKRPEEAVEVLMDLRGRRFKGISVEVIDQKADRLSGLFAGAAAAATE